MNAPATLPAEPDCQPIAQGPAYDEDTQRALAHLAAIVDGTDDAIVSMGLDGRIRSWNRGAERIFGYTADEAIGRSILIIIPPELRDQEQRILEMLARGERIDHFETVRLTREGERRNISLTISPIRDAGGALIGASKIARDITNRVLGRRAISEGQLQLASEARQLARLNEYSARLWHSRTLQEGFEAMVVASARLLGAQMASVRLVDPTSGRLTLVAQHGLRAEYVQLHRELPPGQLSCADDALKQNERIIIPDIEADEVTEAFRELPRAAGCRALVALPLRSGDGTLLGALSMGLVSPGCPSERALSRLDLYVRQASDFIVRCRQEQALRDSEEALRFADRQKDEFLALLGHELRNPLATICNASVLLTRLLERAGTQPEPLAERTRAGVALVQRQASLLTRLVDDLLDVARITRGRIELQRRPIELSEVITQAVETVEPLLRQKEHRLSMVRNHGPLYVHGDAVRLAQAIGNLLTNAAKYTDPRGDIRIESRAESGQAVVEVVDNGCGIPPELLPRVFELFVQVDRTLDRAQGGLGIGLQVVKKLVEMHGGSVAAYSAGPGQGARFEMRLPLTDAPMVAGGESGRIDVSPRRVFIVDDNVDGATSLAMLLQAEGHEVQVAHSGQEALARIEAFRPDVVLLDIGMPEMSGYELLQRLQGRPALRAAKFVALTGYGQPEDRRNVYRAGFAGHLLKPVSMAALARTLGGEAPARG